MTAPTGRGRKLARCQVCDTSPVAMSGVTYCFACWPGGPVTAPPCLKCGSHEDYYATGLCRRCHKWGDPGPDSCRDCLAWGARRTNQWLCQGCCHWRVKYANPAKGGGIGPCHGCRRTVMLGARGVCRLCHKQATFSREGKPFDAIAANQHGQQLFLADMFTRHKSPTRRPGQLTHKAIDATAAVPRPAPPPRPAVPHWLTLHDQQLTLFTMKPDLAAHGRAGLHQRAHPDDVAPLEAVARDLARSYRWSTKQRNAAIIGTRIMLGIQDDGRAPVRASEVEALRDIDLPVWSVIKVLDTAGALIDDRTPAIDTWFHERVDPLPAPMAEELGIWFDIMKNGTNIAPRLRARAPTTIQLHLHWALPALHAWAGVGHTSLREITREDILNAMPSGGLQRPRVGQGLKSIFRLLKGRKVLFVDPTSRIKTGQHEPSRPLPLDTGIVADRLHSENPATALVVAMIAFHGLRAQPLRRLLLTDIVDGRITVDGRTIPLADPVRERLTTYLNYRNARWPDSMNPHLFIHYRTQRNEEPVGHRWVLLTIGAGLTPRRLREDRILNEADATGGDVRAIADLFGLSVQASTRYLSTLEAEDLAPSSRTHGSR
jgi:integrase